MATFSEYYEKALAARGGASSPAARAPLYGPSDGSASAPEEGGNPDFFKDPIGATLDFLSRGVYGATNVVSGMVDDALPTVERMAQGDYAGGISEMLFKAAFNPEAPVQFIEGLTTDQPDKKRFFSDVIEESTDKAGKKFDSDYVDRVDNVAGPLKAIAGFTGDVALDPLSYVPIPVGAIVKGAKAITGKGAKAAEAVAERAPFDEAAVPAPAEAVREPAMAGGGGVRPSDFLKPADPEQAGLERAMADAVDRGTFLQTPPHAGGVLDEVAETAPVPEPFVGTKDEKLFLGVGGNIPKKPKYTSVVASDVLDAVASPVKPTKAKVERARVAVEKIPEVEDAPQVAQAVAKVEEAALEPVDEARNIWVGIEDSNFAIKTDKGEVPVTQRMLQQAVEMERAGTLDEGWSKNLSYFREWAKIQRETKIAAETEKFHFRAEGAVDDAAKATPENASAARMNAENGEAVTPAKIEGAKKTQGTASQVSSASAALAAGLDQAALTPGEILKGSVQGKKMRALLDTVEMMVKAGEVPAVPARSPIIPGTKGFGHTEVVISDYVASFDYWVANGLEDLADKSGRVALELADGREVKIPVEDIRQMMATVNDFDNYVIEDGVSVPAGEVDYQVLQAVDNLFREEIDLGYMNPAREAVEITNVVDAWQYLIREKNELIRAQMGEYGYEYLLQALGHNKAKFVERMDVIRRLLDNDFDASNLENLREMRRLHRPQVEMLDRELMLGLDEALSPASPRAVEKAPAPAREGVVTEPAPEQVAELDEVDQMMREDFPEYFGPDPTPSNPRPQDTEGVAPEVVEEIVSTPSTITPKPSSKRDVTGITTALKEGVAGAPDTSRGALIKVVGDTLSKVFGDIAKLPETHPYRTKRGVLRTEQALGEGRGAYQKKFNTQDQYNVYAQSTKAINEYSVTRFKELEVPSKQWSDLKSKNRTRWQARLLSEYYDLLDKALNKMGVKQVIGFGDDLIPLSLNNILQGVKGAFFRMTSNAQLADDAYLLTMFNYSTQVNPTNLMEATRVMLWGGTDEEIAAVLRNTEKFGPKGSLQGEKMANRWVDRDLKDRNGKPIVDDSGYVKGFHVTLGQRKNFVAGTYSRNMYEEIFPRAKVVQTDGKGVMHSIQPHQDDLVEATVRALRGAEDELARTAVNNGWRQAERGATETYDMATGVLKAIDDLYGDPLAMSAFLRSVDDIPDTVARAGTETGAYQDSVDAATEIIRTSIGDDIVSEATNLGKIDKASSPRKGNEKGASKRVEESIDDSSRTRVADAIKPLDEEVSAQRGKEMLEANVEPRLNADDPAVRAQAVGDTIEIYDLSSRVVPDFNTAARSLLGRAGHSFRQTFDVRYGHERIHDIEHNKSLISQEVLGTLHLRLSDLSKRHGKDALNEAFERIQLGAPLRAGDEVQEELTHYVSMLWDPGDNALFSNLFLNVEKNIEYVNNIISVKFSGAAKNPVGDNFLDISTAKIRSKEEFGTPDLYHRFLGEQWRSLKVEDAADFLSRMTDAALTVVERKAIVETFVQRAKQWGAVSYTPKEGFVKVPNAGNPSAFSVFLPQQINGHAVYWDKDLIKELHHADILTTTSRQMQGEVGQAVRKYFMPLQDAWKVSITIYRPGHHIRNAVGDASITWVKRGNRNYASSMRDAFKVMAMRNDYSDVDLVKALKAVDGIDSLPAKQGDVIVRGRLGGKDVEITAGEILELTHRKGLRPTYHMSEGLFDDAVVQSKVAKAVKVIALQENTKGQVTAFNKFAGGVSQARDHYARTQHFIQILQQELGKGGPFTGKQFSGVKDLDDLFDRAAAEVKKFHPDASMLTPRESKYFRVAIPFYSWFSKILPVVFESMLRHPGRFMMFPKASYELAVATGVNPDSIYDPFPTDQLFPSFITEKALGPQFQNAAGEYIGINPGITHLDVFNTLGPDPVRGILGMTTPLVRTPFEILAGGSLGTGARINDASDYLDESIPGVNYLSDVLGVSVTGSLGSVLSGQPGLDPQFQVARGNKGGFASDDMWMSIANWATGMGAQNLSRPNLINYAELERKRGEVPTE